MTTKLLRFFTSAYTVMGIVILKYLVASYLKIKIGSDINSPMITGDGFHNLSDIFQALAVIAVVFVAKLPASNSYPFGRKNIEFFSSLLIGGTLLYLAIQFAGESVAGLLHFFPQADSAVRSVVPILPTHESLVMESSILPWVLAITAGSALSSLILSRYQIFVGRSTGHSSVVADGEETASDARIEIVTVIGVIAEYVFHAAWLEYPLGLLVAFLIARTGWELFSSAFRVLLQASLGDEHESNIRKICMETAGVLAMTKLKTFRVGGTAVVMATIETRRRSDAVAHIKYGIEHALRRYLLEADFKECELQLQFQKPEPAAHRVAYALIVRDGQSVVAPTLETATHFAICDIKRGGIYRSKLEAKPDDVNAFLVEKRVSKVFVSERPPHTVKPTTVEVLQANSSLPSVLGL